MKAAIAALCLCLGLYAFAEAFRPGLPLRAVRTRVVRAQEGGEFEFVDPNSSADGPAAIESGFIPTVNTFDVDKILPESFHGYLKEEFTRITGDARGTCAFSTFYDWKSSHGIVFSREEVQELWAQLFGSPETLADLKNFIDITQIIDEQ